MCQLNNIGDNILKIVCIVESKIILQYIFILIAIKSLLEQDKLITIMTF